MTLNWQQQTTFANSVFSAFSSKLLLRVIKVTNRMALADLISLSRSPPIWFTRGGFLFHLIQSAIYCAGRPLAYFGSILPLFWLILFLLPWSVSILTSDGPYTVSSSNKISENKYEWFCFHALLSFPYWLSDLPKKWKVLHNTSRCFFVPLGKMDEICPLSNKWMVVFNLF